MFDPSSPHNDLPLLPPSTDVESKAVLRRCIRARTALAELNIAGQLIPNQTVLSSIPLLEAKVSSEIENIVTTNDNLFRQANLFDDAADAATKEALRYRNALYESFNSLRERPISTRTAVEICRRIKGIDLDVRSSLVSVKSQQEVIYTPPHGEALLRSLLGNWEHFVNQPSELDPVIRMAIQHCQFEAIHPFIDGNGRTGRILNVLCLNQYGLLNQPVLYLSRHILAQRADYYRLLQRVTTDGEWEPWILYILEGVESTAVWTAHKI